MQTIFEEYGRVILVVIVGVLLFGLIFGGIQIYRVMGEQADVQTTLSHSASEAAVKEIADRNVPKVSVTDSKDLHLYIDDVLHPIGSVQCLDHDGKALPVVVTSILFIDENGTRTEHIDAYDKSKDELDISSVANKSGALAVTFKAVDDYNITAIQTISFVVDDTTK